MADKTFPKGIFFKTPPDNAPDYVKGKVLFHFPEALEYLNTVEDEWLSLDMKVSRDGKSYLEVDTWRRDNQQPKPEPQQGISYDNQNTTFEKDEELGF